MILAVIGAGGKTGLVHALARRCRVQGRRVFVTTTTHMFIEPDTLICDDPDVICRELDRCGYVMAGTGAGGKIGPLSRACYEAVCARADVVLVEADGARHRAVKVPGPGEPVIPENADCIVLVLGLHALGRTLREAAHRPEAAAGLLGVDADTRITPEHILQMAQEGYMKPLARRFPEKKLLFWPAQDGSPAHRAAADYLSARMNVVQSMEELL